MNELDYNSTKRKIESQKCTEHNENPEIYGYKEGLEINLYLI